MQNIYPLLHTYLFVPPTTTTLSLSLDIMINGKHGVQLHPDIIELFIMLFADDVDLLSYTPVGLQHQLNLLARNADALDLTVNLEKSNIVVFRNGGYLARCEE